jgi:serine/threonine protein kinase
MALIGSISVSMSTYTVTAIISAVRTFSAPFVMYWTLVRDTRYWNDLVGEDDDDPQKQRSSALVEVANNSGVVIADSDAQSTQSTAAATATLKSSSTAHPLQPNLSDTRKVPGTSWWQRRRWMGVWPFIRRSDDAASLQKRPLLPSSASEELQAADRGSTPATSLVNGAFAVTKYGALASSVPASPLLQQQPAPARPAAIAVAMLQQGRVPSVEGFLPHSEVHDTYKQLGRGGQALVTLGKWRGRDVALKKSLPEDMHRQDAVDAMMRESMVYRALSACPQIVRFFGLVRSPPHMYMVLELCRGGSLYSALGDDIEAMQTTQDYSESRRTLSWEAKLRIARDVAAALAFIHGAGLAHMDVKSANVLLKPPAAAPLQAGGARGGGSSSRSRPGLQGGGSEVASCWSAVLADFGEYVDVSRTHEPLRRRLEKQRGGTAHYKAPERLLPRSFFDASADVYAFGVLLWELITYRYPYYEQQLECRSDAEFELWLQREVPAGRRPTDESDAPWLAEAPAGLPELMEQCWATLPRDRPSAAQVVADLGSILDAWLETGTTAGGGLVAVGGGGGGV